ncbi:MAG: hypothetical protein V7L29_06735 [Nostoc sp.]|uniref:hypothetical protein n=1 Tax=Nostoc sp. TaxID=1180 RepID=UPI002FF3C164
MSLELGEFHPSSPLHVLLTKLLPSYVRTVTTPVVNRAWAFATNQLLKSYLSKPKSFSLKSDAVPLRRSKLCVASRREVRATPTLIIIPNDASRLFERRRYANKSENPPTALAPQCPI